MTGFTSTFGGNVVNPAYTSYAAYTTSANLVLEWAFEADTAANVVGAKTDIFASAPLLTIAFPDATLVSNGTDVVVRNTGTNAFTVVSANGSVITSVAAGQSIYIFLLSNATIGGSWGVVPLGTGTTNANAGALAGAGLKAILSTLNQNLIIQPKPGSYSPVSADRSTVLQSTGGAVVYTPDSAVTLGNGWFVYVINSGSGTLTWTPSGGQTIDGSATKVLNPGENAIFFSDGSNFWTLGYGRSITAVVTGAVINLAAAPATVNLSATQSAAQVQDYTGLLTTSVTVNYGTGVGFWFVRNTTSGPFNLTLAVNGSDPGVVIPQGNYAVIRSNGSNTAIAFTAAGTGTVTSVGGSSDFTGVPITSAGVIALTSVVTPGTYGGGLKYPQVTVSATGRVTGIAEIQLGTASGADLGTAAGNVPVLDANGMLATAVGGMPTGAVMDYIGVTAPTGWIFATIGTIGSAASGATILASAVTQPLFTLLWNSWANAQAPVSGGRGASAAADFAANKTIAVPDLRGIGRAALDNNGGAANANRLSSVMASTTPGATGGGQTQTANTNVTFSSTGTNSISVSGSVSGTVFVFSGGVGVGGTASGTSVPVDNNGGGSQVGVWVASPLTVSGSTNTINSNGGNTLSGSMSGANGITVSGGGTFGSGAFSVLQPTMVMSTIIKL
jgi:hypothetical protein